MRYAATRLVYSPSDLVVFLDSDFASWMDRWNVLRTNGNEAVVNELGMPLGGTLDGITFDPDAEVEERRLIAAKGGRRELAAAQV